MWRRSDLSHRAPLDLEAAREVLIAEARATSVADRAMALDVTRMALGATIENTAVKEAVVATEEIAAAMEEAMRDDRTTVAIEGHRAAHQEVKDRVAEEARDGARLPSSSRVRRKNHRSGLEL